MPADTRGHVVGGASFAPLVAELSGRAAKSHAHVGVTEHKDWAFFVDTFGYHKFEVAVPVLGDAQESDGLVRRRIELGQIPAASLAMEHGYNLHGGFASLRDVRIAGP